MKKHLIILLLILGSLTTLHSQVPGYMGKRFNLYGGMSFFPSFGNSVNIEQQSQYLIVYGVNWKADFGVDFSITRKSSIGLSGHYFSTASRFGDSRLAMEVGGVGAVFKTFFGSWVAPVGSYYRLEVGAFIYNVSDPLNGTPGFVPYLSGTPYINNAIGRTHVFANVITLDYGFEVGLAFPLQYNDPTYGSQNLRLLFHNLANVYCKLGVVF